MAALDRRAALYVPSVAPSALFGRHHDDHVASRAHPAVGQSSPVALTSLEERSTVFPGPAVFEAFLEHGWRDLSGA